MDITNEKEYESNKKNKQFVPHTHGLFGKGKEKKRLGEMKRVRRVGCLLLLLVTCATNFVAAFVLKMRGMVFKQIEAITKNI